MHVKNRVNILLPCKIAISCLNSMHAGLFFMLFCRMLIFSKSIFKKTLSGIPSACQTVWIQIRTDIMLVLIWVQTVCKGYLQTTKVAASKKRVNDVTRLHSL